MQLNELQPNPGSKSKKIRVGRGFTRGKTCGRGHKGQKSRSGGKVRIGFEGGQIPLYMRLPKVGFTSRVKKFSASLRLSEINLIQKLMPELEKIDLEVIKLSGLVGHDTRQVKVFSSGEVTEKVNLVGIRVSKGAKIAIEAVGGTVTEASE
jgi:large subunit ribosomal protein L15|tara:strand:- start:6896 stop:7348 length:453 start_codon:yes stop_codon:yes gene_type:complete